MQTVRETGDPHPRIEKGEYDGDSRVATLRTLLEKADAKPPPSRFARLQRFLHLIPEGE